MFSLHSSFCSATKSRVFSRFKILCKPGIAAAAINNLPFLSILVATDSMSDAQFRFVKIRLGVELDRRVGAFVTIQYFVCHLCLIFYSS